MLDKPILKPICPNFGSGPTAKFPTWTLENLESALVGRSHRSVEGQEKLSLLITRTRKVLHIPDSYKIAIMPGSATGAMESALWSFLGPLKVDVIAFDIFGELWAKDLVEQLKMTNVQTYCAEYGQIPNLEQCCSNHDIVFTWNGTTSGTWIPHADWISDHRKGLTLCDATSAAFCVDLPWEKLDVTAFSWQKGLGGEAAHGMLVLSPQAIQRLEVYRPFWPVPRLFRFTLEEKLRKGIFKGETINTPSMLCVEDCLKALQWAESIGGLKGLIQRCKSNFQVLEKWIKQTPWIDFMAHDSSVTSPISVCLVFPHLRDRSSLDQRDFLVKFSDLLKQNQVAYDVVNHQFAPPSLRIWCGPTVETTDIKLLIPWLEWTFEKAIKNWDHID